MRGSERNVQGTLGQTLQGEGMYRGQTLQGEDMYRGQTLQVRGM